MAYIVPQTFQPCKGERTDLPNGLKQLSTISEILISRNVNPIEGRNCSMVLRVDANIHCKYKKRKKTKQNKNKQK